MDILFAPNITASELRAGDWRLASTRYRAAIPAAELARLGLAVEHRPMEHFFRPGADCAAGALVLAQPKAPIVRIGAMLTDYIGNFERFAAAGGKLVIDVCDYKFGPEYGPLLEKMFGAEGRQAYETLLRRLFAAARLVTVPTAFLAEQMRGSGVWNGPITVIGDPIEVARGTARFAPGWPLNLLWFGTYGVHRRAMEGFIGGDLPRLARQGDVMLHLVCEPNAPLPAPPPGVRLRQSAWSLPAMNEALAACDLVAIPFERGAAETLGKSNNRALQALYAGRAVAAHPIPSYSEMAGQLLLGDDLAETIAAALGDPPTVTAMIAAAQEAVAERYAPEAIGRAWRDAIALL